MRYSRLFPKTIKEAPSEEVAVNAKLLLRGGFIDKLMSGSYTLLPLGKQVEQKITQIVREEMNNTGAQEFLMPLLHPKSIWNETGRWESAREVMYQFEKDEKEFALSFTHEEIFLDVVRKHVSSYKDFPVKLYHFSTKFRAEMRAKSGILRGREFLMKDLYSAHASQEDLDAYYDEVKEAYLKTFERLGLAAVVTEAAGGVFTDNVTHEFQVVADSGEDEIIYCPGGDFSQNLEIIKEPEQLEGKQCDLGHGPLKRVKAIEVGNIFRFGTSYSEKMGVSFTSDSGKKQHAYLGSYGIGITRMIGVLAEVFHDEKGLMWPEPVAPFKAHLITLGNQESGIMNQGEVIYKKLQEVGIDVLWDDRDVSPGEKFADADLLGMPYRLVVSKKTEGKVEVKKRNEEKTELMEFEQVIKKLS
ncbi:MAG: proline--tRNA ligase [Candidatus Levyibacteriota bacterium]